MSRHCISWNYEALWGVNNEMWVCVCVWPAPVCPTIGPQLVSEPSTVQTCDTQLWSATHCHIQHGGCVLHHRPNIPLLINCSRYCIGHETASIFKYWICTWIMKIFLIRKHYTGCLSATPQKTKQFQMSHFHLMIFYSEAVVILKSTHHFQFYTSWVSDVLRSLYMLQFKTAQCICIFTWWSIVSVDMIVICCHELEHDQTWLIFSMTI